MPAAGGPPAGRTAGADSSADPSSFDRSEAILATRSSDESNTTAVAGVTAKVLPGESSTDDGAGMTP